MTKNCANCGLSFNQEREEIYCPSCNNYDTYTDEGLK